MRTYFLVFKLLIIVFQVNLSQRLSEKPLTPFRVVCEKKGKILAAHCDCMAGLGESCTHVVSFLRAVEFGVKRRESLTITEKSAYRVLPTAVKNITYASIRHIQFFKSAADPRESSVSSPPPKKFADFLKNVQMLSPSKLAVFSLMPEFSDAYVPSSLKEDLPPLFSEFTDRNHNVMMLLIGVSMGSSH